MNLSDFTRFYENVLTDTECDSVIKYYNEQQEADAFIIDENGEPSVSSTTRKSKFVQVERDSLTDLLLYSAIQKIIEAYVKHLSSFKLEGSELTLLSNLPQDVETAPYLINKYDEGGFYDWHTDQGYGSDMDLEITSRMISILIYLNDDFEGGLTELPFGHFVPKKGCAAVFPSDWKFPHRSTPITKGKKYSIATWLKPKSVV